MSIWDWIADFRRTARATHDPERLRLLGLQDAALNCRNKDPQNALRMLAEGRALAERLCEPWWVLHLDHWCVQVVLHDLRDVRSALELAVRAALEARKPEYDRLPQRVCLHEDLVFSYIFTDPVGYSEGIHDALEYMRAEAGGGVECRYCIEKCAARWALLCDRLHGAEQAARHVLQMADEDSNRASANHHGNAAHDYLCEVAHRRGDWEALADHAEAGEELARRSDDPAMIAQFLIWRALRARRDGDENSAGRFVRQAAARLARTGVVPSATYYRALCAFHEAGGDLQRALHVRDVELRSVAGKGQWFQECRARVDRCRLLRQMGRPLEAELAAAREAANRLRQPAAVLDELKRIEDDREFGAAQEHT